MEPRLLSPWSAWQRRLTLRDSISLHAFDCDDGAVAAVMLFVYYRWQYNIRGLHLQEFGPAKAHILKVKTDRRGQE